MSVPCEVAVKCVLPVIRAMIARELVSNHGLRQVEAARLLGVSQPAISLYSRSIRGRAIDLEGDSEIKHLVVGMAEAFARGPISRRELILMYCRICRAIRAKGLLCKLHIAFDPSVGLDKCELCMTDEPVRCT